MKTKASSYNEILSTCTEDLVCLLSNANLLAALQFTQSIVKSYLFDTSIQSNKSFTDINKIN